MQDTALVVIYGSQKIQKYSRRLHEETNCGRHRSWPCTQCGPNLLTEDPCDEHMEVEHKIELEDEDVFTMPAIELNVTSNENAEATELEDIAKMDTQSEDSSGDPLLLIRKIEKCDDPAKETTTQT